MDIQLVTLTVGQSGTELIVPKEFFAYRALDEVESVSAGADVSLVRFGEFGMDSSMYFDVASSQVLYGMSAEDAELVNTSLSRFTQCIVRLGRMFPFYDDVSEVEEWEEAANRVERTIREIDPDAYHEGAYWYEFRWDVSMGDFHG
ncbi:SUKH-4 family immunity protein [Streptomyces tendae]|uniref:SUKH-4 family immunity protein n=1 Tax=Streptomyces tendae TaxID=1932 RepID=UPI003711A353